MFSTDIFFFEEGTINDVFNIERNGLPGKSGFLVTIKAKRKIVFSIQIVAVTELVF